MITDRLPAPRPRHRSAARGRRLLGAALARPSLRALLGLVVVVAFFAVQAPGLLTSGGLASVLDIAAPLGIGGSRWRCCWSPASSTCPSASSPWPARLVTALLIEHAGWGIWPALAGSLAAALLVGAGQRPAGGQHRAAELPGHPGDLPRPAGQRAGRLRAIAGSVPGQRAGRGDRAGTSAAAVFGSTAQLGDGRFRISLLWWLVRDRADHLAAVAHPVRQRRVRRRRRPPAPPASSASRWPARPSRCSAWAPPPPAG